MIDTLPGGVEISIERKRERGGGRRGVTRIVDSTMFPFSFRQLGLLKRVRTKET